MRVTRVLVTNDDGVESPGLAPLVRAVVQQGHEVVVVAPDRDMSGSAAAIGQIHVDQGVEATPVELEGLAGVPAHAVDGPPGLCVLAARLGGFGDPPELVVSGINPGCNTGRAVLHSGTVGAALTAANFGCRGLAVSLDVSSRRARRSEGAPPAPPSGEEPATVATRDGEEATAAPVVDDAGRAAEAAADEDQDAIHWETAAAMAQAALGWLVDTPDATVLNVNVPNLPLGRLAGVRRAELASFGTVRASVVEAAADGGRLQMELRPTNRRLPPDSDTALVAQGFVAVTPITGIRAASLGVAPLLDMLAVDTRSTA